MHNSNNSRLNGEKELKMEEETIEQQDALGQGDEQQDDADGSAADDSVDVNAEGANGEKTDDAKEEEIVVSIGDEEVQKDSTPAPKWVKELRKSHREAQRKLKEYESKLQAMESTKEEALGKKPTLEDSDYDTDAYEAAVQAWYERKRKIDAKVEQQQAAEAKQREDWAKKLEEYGKAKSSLKVKDYEEAEDIIQNTLSVTQQGIILQGAENPALVVYALGKNHKRATELSKIDDPVKFAFAVAKLEKDLRVSNRKAPPAPEKTVNGSSKGVSAIDSALEKLRAEAAMTGDYTKVHRYKRQQKTA